MDLLRIRALDAGFSSEQVDWLSDHYGQGLLSAITTMVATHQIFSADQAMAMIEEHGPESVVALLNAVAEAKGAGQVSAKALTWISEHPEIHRAFWHWAARTLPGLMIEAEPQEGGKTRRQRFTTWLRRFRDRAPRG